MLKTLAWMMTAAILSVPLPALASQDDPRLDGLFAALKSAPDEETAAPIELRIWSLWLDTGNDEFNHLIADGMTAMADREFSTADEALTAVVERAPDLVAGWNARATLYYLMGAYDRSTADVEKALALEPRHFGALSGLGLIRLVEGDEAGALDAFERALAIHPNLTAAEYQVRALREKLEGRGI